MHLVNCLFHFLFNDAGMHSHFSFLLEVIQDSIPHCVSMSTSDMYADRTILTASYRLDYSIFQKEQGRLFAKIFFELKI